MTVPKDAPQAVKDALAAARWHAVRAQGAGGQHVNTASTAVHLWLDLRDTELPAAWCQRLCQLQDRRISPEGVIVIKAQQHRSQAMNRRDAFEMLRELLMRAAAAPHVRRPTRPPRAAKRRRLKDKRHRGGIKAQRGRPGRDDG